MPSRQATFDSLRPWTSGRGGWFVPILREGTSPRVGKWLARVENSVLGARDLWPMDGKHSD